MQTTPRYGRTAGLGPEPGPAAPDTLDFLAWLDREPRAYSEVMEFWRTSCPKLPVWDDAVDRGLVVRRR